MRTSRRRSALPTTSTVARWCHSSQDQHVRRRLCAVRAILTTPADLVDEDADLQDKGRAAADSVPWHCRRDPHLRAPDRPAYSDHAAYVSTSGSVKPNQGSPPQDVRAQSTGHSNRQSCSSRPQRRRKVCPAPRNYIVDARTVGPEVPQELDAGQDRVPPRCKVVHRGPRPRIVEAAHSRNHTNYPHFRSLGKYYCHAHVLYGCSYL